MKLKVSLSPQGDKGRESEMISSRNGSGGGVSESTQRQGGRVPHTQDSLRFNRPKRVAWGQCALWDGTLQPPPFLTLHWAQVEKGGKKGWLQCSFQVSLPGEWQLQAQVHTLHLQSSTGLSILESPALDIPKLILAL
jgi:hypothetical protein